MRLSVVGGGVTAEFLLHVRKQHQLTKFLPFPLCITSPKSGEVILTLVNRLSAVKLDPLLLHRTHTN